MKKIKLLWAIIFATVMSLGFTACSSDDDEPEDPQNDISQFTNPTMADEAARFTITDADAPYSSVELTESGKYVVLPSFYAQTQAADQAKPKCQFASVNPAQSRSGADGVFTGKYTKVSEGEYILEGFGSLTVTGSSQEACELIICLENGTEINLGAQKEEVLATDPTTLALCRSWKFEQVRFRETYSGIVVSDRSSDIKDLSNLSKQIGQDIYNFMQKYGALDEGDTPSDYEPDLSGMAEEAIFTKTGSYLLFLNGQLSANIWRWNNKDEREIRYSHNISDLQDPEYSNNAWLTFNGTQLTVYESRAESDEGDIMKIETWSTLSELK